MKISIKIRTDCDAVHSFRSQCDNFHEMATFNAVHEIFIDELSVRVYSNGTGRPVLMLHDLGSSVGWFADLSGPLVLAGREFVAIDLPGCGYSDAVRDAGLAATIAHLAEVLTKLFDNPVDIVGRGYGAYLALSLAAASPGQVNRLVLDSPTLPPRNGPVEKIKMAPAMAISGAGATLRRGRLLQNLSGLNRAKTTLAELARSDPNWWESVGQISCPTLIVDDGDQNSRAKLDLLRETIRGCERGASLAAARKFVPAPALTPTVLVGFLD